MTCNAEEGDEDHQGDVQKMVLDVENLGGTDRLFFTSRTIDEGHSTRRVEIDRFQQSTVRS